MKVEPVIIVVTYNRPASLLRLLNSLSKAEYQQSQVKLIISIDQGDSDSCFNVAQNFNWLHGEKEIILQPNHLGLKEHILTCGDLTRKYESVIILEDDLYLSFYFYSYACEAKRFYEFEENVAGVSLYNYQVSESSFYPFQPIDDGSDVYFIQVPSSWGQLWTRNQWLSFRTWLETNHELREDANLPKYLFEWGQHSWKKHFIHYLIATNKYFVFPRLSLSTNFEEPGTNSTTKGVFQVPLQLHPRTHNFRYLNDSGAKYDAWFEIAPECINSLNQELRKFDYAVDLQSKKEVTSLKNEFVLTTRHSDDAILSFGSELFPLEANVIKGLNGVDIGLYKTKDSNWLDRKLRLPNLFIKTNLEDETFVSVVLPLHEYSSQQFQTTFHSILNQSFENIELIISTYKKYCHEIEKALSYSHINYRIIINDDSIRFENLLQKGIESVSNKVLCWIQQGTVFELNCFSKVISVFKQNPMINWMRGIDEFCDTQEAFSKVKTYKYRIVVEDVYRRTKINELDISTELHFFNAHIFKHKKITDFTTHGLFSQLILNYQLYVVVTNFGQVVQSHSLVLTNQVKELLSNQFKPLQNKASFKSRLIYFLIRTPLFNDGSWQWYLTSLKNYPDVLRFDEVNKSYYYSKY